MRPFEAALLFADVLAFLALVLAPLRTSSWARLLPPVALLVAIVQVAVEGARWQMLPAYALAGLFFLVWAARTLRPGMTLTGHDWTDRLVIVFAVVLAVLGLLVSIGLPAVFPVFHFPEPTGKFGIGTTTYHWTDTDRPEIFSADPRARRELVAQVWYPTKRGSSGPPAPYIQDSDQVTRGLARLFKVPSFTFAEMSYVKSDAVASAPVATERSSYPVLVFLEGLDGFRQMNTFQVENLVSHGYIVVAVDQPYTSDVVVFPDGRHIPGLSKSQLDPFIQRSIAPTGPAPALHGRLLARGIIPYLAQDASYTLDKLSELNAADGTLKGTLDLQHVGVLGISLGGIVAPEAAHSDPRFRAVVVMDAPITADVAMSGLHQPSMGITRDVRTMQLERWSRLDIAQTQDTMRALFEKTPSGDAYFVRVPGMFHLNMTDLPYWMPLFSRIGVTGPIDPHRAHDIVNAYTLAFFDKHLKGMQEPLLDARAKPYGEVLLERR